MRFKSFCLYQTILDCRALICHLELHLNFVDISDALLTATLEIKIEPSNFVLETFCEAYGNYLKHIILLTKHSDAVTWKHRQQKV